MRTPLLALALVALGCGGKTNEDAPDASTTGETGADSSSDSGMTDSAATDAPPSVCNALDNSAAQVQPESRPETAPVPTGGMVSDGTYELISSITYTGPGGSSGPRGEPQKITVKITGSAAQVVQQLGDAKHTHGTATVTFGGTRVSMTYTCPTEFAAPWDGYDASGDRLSLHNTAIGLVATFAKR